MKLTCQCGRAFVSVNRTKTCSAACQRARNSQRQRDYNAANPRTKRIQQLRAREVIVHIRMKRKLDRAVRLLFALTGEPDDNQANH